jgi:general secretion pathway protein J
MARGQRAAIADADNAQIDSEEKRTVSAPPVRDTVDAGFTLLELLVAMTLLGLLTLVLLGGLRFGTQIWQTSEEAMSDGNAIRSAQAELTRDISSAYPAFASIDPAHARILFTGQSDSMSLLAPDGNLPGSMARISIGVWQDNGHLTMGIESRPELMAPSAPGPSRTILLRGLKSLQFAYFGSDAPHGELTWHGDWQDRTVPPALVRVRVVFADKRARAWPDLIVAPRISADASCVLDPLTKYCQGR